uniref:peptidyl-prolyl cis-trans isomerase FKBP43-like n=1 Tax=Erigeron canadensis TaxID=72917 RepID=UPI001CB9952E|nr:peptidyl-prolyl cis-trans isomerase FKBP43-like [Erigeron canadensis]
MVFWGIEVKPGNPYTHKFMQGGGRLRISQATLAIGTATLRSSVQCNVGDKRPVLLCALLPHKNESLQLDLEFDEAEDIVFSVIGPRAVYLTGYYVGHNRQSNMQDESESYGEDIANSDTQESNYGSDEDEYEDSFINDDDPESLTPSPVSSDDDVEDVPNKKQNLNGGHKRLKKRCQLIESDDELIVQDTDEDDDLPISSICKNDKSPAPGERTNKHTTEDVENVTKGEDDKHKLETVSSPVLGSKDTVDVDLMDVKEEGNGGHSNAAEAIPEKKSKAKKKRQDSSKEEKATDVLADKDDQKPNDTKIVDHPLEVLDSAEVVPDKNLKPKKKRKGRSEVSTDATDDILLAENKQEDDQQATHESSCANSNQLVNENGPEEKKVKKKRRKSSKTNEVEQNIDAEKETKSSTAAPESCNKKELSNGLVIEYLLTGGKSEGKVAAVGRKVKVNYVVKLKENEMVVDSNGKSPYKFRLGDKEVIEGLNVGLDGMRVGDKRRLTIPPSMSLGFKGTGENIPPSSWLVYEVEMTSIH